MNKRLLKLLEAAEEKMIKNKQDVLDYFEAEDESMLEKYVYKYTDCGAWVKLTDGSVQFGSIVEGSDVSIDTDPLVFPFPESQIEETIQYIEAEAELEWKIANDEFQRGLDDDDDIPGAD